MKRAKQLALPLLAAAIGIVLEVVGYCYYQGLNLDRGERVTLTEVASVARESGLYPRSDREDGTLGWRLIVSDRPISLGHANGLYFGDAKHPRWRGVVAISVPWLAALELSDPAHFVVWRGLFVFGDPAVIHRLTGMHTQAW
jgi:hypothetical protein